MALDCLLGCSTSQHFKHFFGRELTPEVRLLERTVLTIRLIVFFPCYWWRVVFHQAIGLTTGTVTLNFIWYSMQITTYTKSISFLQYIFLQICVPKWNLDMLIAFFSFAFLSFFNYNPFRWCWMVFITLEVNEKMNYIHIQLKKWKRSEMSQGNCSRFACILKTKRKKKKSVFYWKSFSDNMNRTN